MTDAYELSKLGYYPRMQEQNDADEPIVGFGKESYPCLFKIGNAFYDFTPFKLASNVWPAAWPNMTDVFPDGTDPNFVSSLTNSYQFTFGFC